MITLSFTCLTKIKDGGNIMIEHLPRHLTLHKHWTPGYAECCIHQCEQPPGLELPHCPGQQRGKEVNPQHPIVPLTHSGIAPALKCSDHATGIPSETSVIGCSYSNVGGMLFLSGSFVMASWEKHQYKHWTQSGGMENGIVEENKSLFKSRDHLFLP